MKPGLLDLLKVRAIIWTRYLNFASIERWSKTTFRRHRPPTGVSPALVRAKELYESEAIPAALKVPQEIPPESKLRYLYLIPYYYATGILFKLYLRMPMRRGVPWSPDFRFNSAFPKNKEGWTDAFEDRSFARLRLQGPNPFLLRHVDGDRFQVDYSPYFKDIFEPVVCEFRLQDEALEPTSIRVGEQSFAPGDDGWERAKIVANGLDARYCVFTRHLLDTHLLIGEAFAVSAFTLAPKHPLRPFLHLFTYGTLVVNDFAYKLLITPASYFIQSRFISGEDALRLFQNSMDAFCLDDLIVPKDVEKRGIDKIPNHPYVADALDAWEVFQTFIRGLVEGMYADDQAVIDDDDLQSWHYTLASLLPNHDVTDLPLDGRQRLIDILCCLLYNNVSHEVCGDFSPFGQSAVAEHKKFINFERLKSGDLDAPPEMSDVFLYDQGAFAGRFNVGGNNMMSLDVDAMTDDEGLRQAVKAFQADLRALDAKLEERNRGRDIPFLRMMPRKWELSISF